MGWQPCRRCRRPGGVCVSDRPHPCRPRGTTAADSGDAQVSTRLRRDGSEGRLPAESATASGASIPAHPNLLKYDVHDERGGSELRDGGPLGGRGERQDGVHRWRLRQSWRRRRLGTALTTLSAPPQVCEP